MQPSNAGFAFSKDGSLRFNSIKSTVVGEYEDPLIIYDSAKKTWSFLNLANASIRKSGDNISYQEVQAYTDMKEVASKVEVVWILSKFIPLL